MANDTPGASELKEGVDYYWQGEYIVFTAHYLLKRGRCCDTGCRHCPYKPEASKQNDRRTTGGKPEASS